jgi:hypothetical protein
MKNYVAVIAIYDWELWEINEWGGHIVCVSAPTFEGLVRTAIERGYLQPPIAVKLGEMPR